MKKVKPNIEYFTAKDAFFYTSVSFLLSVVMFIVVGEKLSIEYLVSISLVVTGGLWSYLSIELTKVKELRAESVRNLEELERASIDLIKKASVLYDCLVDYSFNKERSVEKRLDRLRKERNEFIVAQNIYVYKSINTELRNGLDVQLEVLEKDMRKMVNKMDKLYMAHGNHDFSINRDDRDEFKELNVAVLGSMSNKFHDIYIDFEEFSDSYRNKKNFCFSIVLLCVFVIVIKSFFG